MDPIINRRIAAKHHPRSTIVKHAERDLHRAIGEWLKNHHLTTAEEIKLLAMVPSRFISGGMEIAIHKEREDGTSEELGT